MNTVQKLVPSAILAILTSGCFYSNKQLSNIFNTGQPIKHLAEVSQFNLQNGNWVKVDTEYVIKKKGFAYRSLTKGKESEETQFALISLGGPYYALEQPGPSGKGKGKFQYSFMKFRNTRIDRWETDAKLMNSMFSNGLLQRELGISCLEDTECEVDSVSDLKKVFAYMLNRQLTPTIYYKLKGGVVTKKPSRQQRSSRQASGGRKCSGVTNPCDWPPPGKWKADYWCYKDFSRNYSTYCRHKNGGIWRREGALDPCKNKLGWCEGRWDSKGFAR